MRPRILAALALAAVLCLPSCGDRTPSVSAEKKAQQSKMDSFVTSLIKQMTLEEKLGQLSLAAAPSGGIVTGSKASENIVEGIREGRIGNLLNTYGVDVTAQYQKIAVEESRLGIPLLFGLDIIHGHRTVFPIPLALASSWDMDAVTTAARVSAIEASADGINWVYSPMVDITRDPRWGRVAEGAGEDPFLGGKVAQAMVLGHQGPADNPYQDSTYVMSCVKHFALYGAAEAGRDYRETDMSLNRMYNEYLPPYKAAVEAGAGSIMNSFNDINGVPASGNKWLLTELLRNQWGFDGFVVTDYTSVSEMIAHGMGDMKKVGELSINAGVDMEMVSTSFIDTVPESLAEGKVDIRRIDAAVRKVLEAKYKLGLFDNPYRYCVQERADKDVYSDEHKIAAREVAAKTIVLLKNSDKDGNPVLPLKKRGTVAVIGPLADAPSNMQGTWAPSSFPSYTSFVDGIREVADEGVKVLYAKGSWLYDDPRTERNFSNADFRRDSRTDEQLLREAVATASRADVIIAALGESKEMSGEAASRTDITIPANQKKLLSALVATGKPVVLTLFTGRPLDLSWESETVPAILNTWFAGSEGAYAIADVLFGDVNPSAKITMSFPRNVGQIPVYYNHKNTGRPGPEGRFQKYTSQYIDSSNEPLYPFGYGLSYTSYEYGDIQLSSDVMKDAPVKASVTVTNTGSVDGDEVVQLYIRDLVGSVTRPVKELKGFRKVHIRAGESVNVEFEITKDMLGFWSTPDFYAEKAGALEGKFVVEPGDFDIMAGPDSRNVSVARLVLE